VKKLFHNFLNISAAVTYTNETAFETAFRHKLPENCVTAFGGQMTSLSNYKMDLIIKGKKFSHRINVINQPNENIIGIDFMH
jgi:hypothetical protein